MRGNAVYENGGPGIDLGNDGATANDPTDSDQGPNGLQNHPELDANQTQLNTSTGDVEVRYRVDTNVGEAVYPLKIDFYLSLDGEEGEIWPGSDSYSSITAALYASVAFQPPPGVTVAGDLAATATDADLEGNTSEFSDPVPLPEPSLPLSLTRGVLLLRALAAGRRSVGSRFSGGGRVV